MKKRTRRIKLQRIRPPQNSVILRLDRGIHLKGRKNLYPHSSFCLLYSEFSTSVILRLDWGIHSKGRKRLNLHSDPWMLDFKIDPPPRHPELDSGSRGFAIDGYLGRKMDCGSGSTMTKFWDIYDVR